MKDASTNTEGSLQEKKDASTQTDDDVGGKQENNSDINDSDATVCYSFESSDGSYTDVHEADPLYDGPCYPSQPCFGRHGVSYTPPGWRRRRVKRKKLMTRRNSEAKEDSDD